MRTQMRSRFITAKWKQTLELCNIVYYFFCLCMHMNVARINVHKHHNHNTAITSRTAEAQIVRKHITRWWRGIARHVVGGGSLCVPLQTVWIWITHNRWYSYVRRVCAAIGCGGCGGCVAVGGRRWRSALAAMRSMYYSKQTHRYRIDRDSAVTLYVSYGTCTINGEHQ